jgi:hypothetical protein
MRLILGAILVAGSAAAVAIALSDRGPSPRLADVGSLAPATALAAGTGPAAALPHRPSSGGALQSALASTGQSSAAVPSALLPKETPSVPNPRVARSGTESTAQLPRSTPESHSRNAVLHELQRQLKRVGCYKGRIGDDWPSATRPSMIAFLERVNAALPTAEPDEILLTIVRATPGQVCGSPCPRGQSMAGGRCQPDALLARNPANEPASSGLTSLPTPAIVAVPAVPGTESSMSPTAVPAPAGGVAPGAEAVADSQPRRARQQPRAPATASARPRNENWVSRAFGSSP